MVGEVSGDETVGSNGKTKRYIAILPLTMTNWPVLRDLALSLRLTGQCIPLVMIPNATIRNQIFAERLPLTCVDIESGVMYEDASKDCTRIPMAVQSASRGFVWPNLIDSRLARWLQISPLRVLMALTKCLQLVSMAGRCRSLLRRFSPLSLVVPGDRESGYLLPMLREAHRHGIPIIVGGGVLSSSANEMLPARRDRFVYHVTRLRSFKRKYQHQWRHDPISGEDISAYGAYMTQAYAWLGMLPDNPWVIGGGASDFVLVESEREKLRLIQQGVSYEKIYVVGHVNHDRLYRAVIAKREIRGRLVEKYGLKHDVPILLFGPTNFAESGILPWDVHWAACRELARIAAGGCENVLVTLHPRQARSDYAFLEREFPPLKILDEPLAEVLPAIDTYFIGLGSSTESWAVQCGVPVVVADHYSLKIRFYEGVPGIAYVQDVSQLADTLHRIHQDPEYRAGLLNTMAANSSLLGKLDGRAVERAMEIVCRPSAASVQSVANSR